MSRRAIAICVVAGISGSSSILAALPLLVVATILLSLGAGSILSRRAAVGHDTALLGMVRAGPREWSPSPTRSAPTRGSSR